MKKKEKKKTIPTSKKLVWFLFVNCTIIELFVGYVTVRSFSLATLIGCMPDFTPLVTLVGAVVSEVVGYAAYSLKAMKENTSGGISYDLAIRELEANSQHEEPKG